MRNRDKNPKLKLSTLLTGLVSASVISTVLILLFSFYQSEKESLTHTYLTLNYSKSQKISSSVDSLIQSMRMSLENTTEFLVNQEGMTDEEIQVQFELLRSNSRYFNSISWIDETGLIRSIAPLSVGLRGQKISTGETKVALDLKKPSLSRPYIAPSGRLLVLMSQPVYDRNGHYRGIVGGTVYLEENNVLNEILGYNIVDENGSYYYVVGPEGLLLYHPDIQRVGEDVKENPIVRKLIQGESGMERVTNTQGIPMLAAYSLVPETHWGVVQQTPVSFVDRLLIDHIQELIFYILPPFLFLLWLSILIARKLAKPFISLADLVNQLSAGNLVSVPEIKSHWNREVDLLTKSVVMAIEVVQKNNQKLVHDATTDPLTGIPNRRLLQKRMKTLAGEGQVFSLIAMDIDHFKSINDTYGHQAGDEVIKFVVQIIQSSVRKTDACFRYGGEEFVLLLPDTVAFEAYSIAEKIRTTLERKTSPVGKVITISLGLSEYPLHSSSLEDLFLFADKALYQSKLNGRNQTTIWSES